MTVDEILATGQYTDRRGRGWHFDETHNDWVRSPLTVESHSISPCQMRLLIERDQHRDKCRGIRACWSHPVPHVFPLGKRFDVYYAGDPFWASVHDALPEAMDAARVLAVGE